MTQVAVRSINATPSSPPPDFAGIKQKQQITWASGDYAVIGTTLQIVGESLAEAVDVRAGERVLDVAAGNGNATLAAARRFADVTSTDYVPSLLDKGAKRAAAEALKVKFQVADAEQLPFGDESFDVALSTFGAMPNHEVVQAGAKRAAAKLDDLELPQCGPVGGRFVIERHDAVGDTLQLQIGPFSCPVVQQQDGAGAVDEELLQRQDLATVAQRTLRQQAQLGQRVEHHPLGLAPLDCIENLAHRLGEFDLRRVIHRQLGVALELALFRPQLDEVDAIERPTMRASTRAQLGGRFRQGDEQAAVAILETPQQVLERERSFTGPGISVDKV